MIKITVAVLLMVAGVIALGAAAFFPEARGRVHAGWLGLTLWGIAQAL